MKILAMKLRALGDTVLMTASLAELRHAYREAEIHAVVHEPWASIIEAHPGADRVIAYRRHASATARARAAARLAWDLRQENYDLVLNFHASPTSARIAFATGAKVRAIHFHGHEDKNRFSTVPIAGKGTLKPIIERDMDTVRALGLHVPAGRLPTLHLHAAETEEARATLAHLGLPQPLLSISLGASRPSKSWPLERWATLAQEWAEKLGGGVYVSAGPDEGALIHEFLKLVDEQLRLTIQDTSKRAALRSRITAHHALSIRQLAAIQSLAAVHAGNDSGPKHLAVAVGTPTVTVFGPEDPFEWHPYPPESHPFLFIRDLPCRRDADPGMPPWCGIQTCVTEEHRCLKLIGVNAVFDQCRKFADRRRAL